MTPELIGVLGFIALFILLAAGMPIGVGMGIIGALGLCFTLSLPAAITKMAITPFELVSNYTFTSLPLFLLMGHVIFSTGQGGQIFKIAAKWFGRTPGGLAMATVAACALFGAVSASSVATAVTMGLVAMPEMKKRGYDPGLATAAFKLSSENPFPESPVRGPQGVFIFHLLERRLPAPPSESAQMDTLKQQLGQRKQGEIYQNWMTQARSQTEIEIDRASLN